MADFSSAQLSGIERRVDKIADTTEAVYQMVENLGSTVQGIEESQQEIFDELSDLREQFERMIDDQRRNAALQQAMTELVRVRQELEQNFGNYKIVRETMLGVLQATDLALVKKNTISRVSEEIMLSTPEYWLAPCLVAVSAWIGNDKDLAERAIKEAMRRDAEKTAITMALICRRNDRTQTCYEWLSIYFSKQSSASFSEGSFAYIDAYVNGIFGRDEKHMCDDYINRWINEIRNNSESFESKQENIWKVYCERFKKNIDSDYPELAANVTEYNQINEYMSRIDSVEPIKDRFSSIQHANINSDALKATIDKRLINLISRYDGKEEPLRQEEHYLQKVKEFNGDVEKAREVCRSEELARKEKTLNMIERMSDAIISDYEQTSQKKTAISFLNGFIQKGFDSYIEEKKTEFPEAITINVNNWVGKTTDGGNVDQLVQNYTNEMEQRKVEELSRINNNLPKFFMIAAIAAGVLSLPMFIWGSAFIGLIMLGGAGFCAYKMFTSKKNNELNVQDITERYELLEKQGVIDIKKTCAQWVEASDKVKQFNNKPRMEIIA